MNIFTIVIPNRNNEKYLREAILSVLGQTSQEFDFLISDNGSTDSSVEIIKSFDCKSLKLIETPGDLSYSEHLEWLLDKIDTEYVIFFAGDDILHSDFIKSYKYELEKSNANSPAFICSQYYSIDAEGSIVDYSFWRRLNTGVNDQMLSVFLDGPICNISSVAWRLEELSRSLVKVKRFGNCVDWALYIDTLLNSPSVLLIKKPLLFYRVHNLSTGNSNVIGHTSACLTFFESLKIEHDFSPTLLRIIDPRMANFRLIIREQDVTKGRESIIKFLFRKAYAFYLNYFTNLK